MRSLTITAQIMLITIGFALVWIVVQLLDIL